MTTISKIAPLALVLGLFAAPANAKNIVVEGRVVTDLRDRVLLICDGATYDVQSTKSHLNYMRAFDRSRRTVKVRGHSSPASEIDEDFGPIRKLTGARAIERKSYTRLKGQLSFRYDGAAVLDTKDKGRVKLTRVPLALLAPLTGKELSISGLLFEDGDMPELLLTSLLDEISDDQNLRRDEKGNVGYLTQRRWNAEKGKNQYRKVADVKPGQKAIVIGLEGWNKKTKESSHVEDMDKDDMLFVRVKVGSTEGWIPAYKLKLGRVVDNALKSFRKPDAQARGQQKFEEQAKDARVSQQNPVVDDQKAGALGKLEKDLEQDGPKEAEQRQIRIPDEQVQIPGEQKQVKID